MNMASLSFQRCWFVSIIIIGSMTLNLILCFFNHQEPISTMQSKTDNDFDWGRDLLNVTQCQTAASPEVVHKAIQLLLKDFQGLKSRIREPNTQNNPLIKFLDDYKIPAGLRNFLLSLLNTTRHDLSRTVKDRKNHESSPHKLTWIPY